MTGYMTIKETAAKWDVSVRWVQTLCLQGKIDGAIKFGHAWAIPAESERPKDGRIKSGRYRGEKRKNIKKQLT